MGVRGKKSAAELSVASGGVSALPRRPEPWLGLDERETEVWRAIVNAQAVDWFSPGDQPLLAAYCKAVALHERVSAEAVGAKFTVFGAGGGEVVNPIFRLQDTAARQMASLAVKLRLSQSAKWTEQKAATKDKAGKGRRPWEDTGTE